METATSENIILTATSIYKPSERLYIYVYVYIYT